MNRATLIVASAVITGAVNGTDRAFSSVYPVAPPNTMVTLQPADFIQSVPEQSPGLREPNSVIGDHLGQHPGAFDFGFPQVGTFFIGVFGGLIDSSRPENAVYLWETSCCVGTNDVAFAGPQVQLGSWDGIAFIPFGMPITAAYLGTGVLEDHGNPPDPMTPPFREITSSIISLSEFGISPGVPFVLNAIRVEVNDLSAHNQVTAVATHVVPEPSMVFLLGCGLLSLLGDGWCRQSSRESVGSCRTT